MKLHDAILLAVRGLPHLWAARPPGLALPCPRREPASSNSSCSRLSRSIGKASVDEATVWGSTFAWIGHVVALVVREVGNQPLFPKEELRRRALDRVLAQLGQAFPPDPGRNLQSKRPAPSPLGPGQSARMVRLLGLGCLEHEQLLASLFPSGPFRGSLFARGGCAQNGSWLHLLLALSGQVLRLCHEALKVRSRPHPGRRRPGPATSPPGSSSTRKISCASQSRVLCSPRSLLSKPASVEITTNVLHRPGLFREATVPTWFAWPASGSWCRLGT